jgi:hypothetical protein
MCTHLKYYPGTGSLTFITVLQYMTLMEVKADVTGSQLSVDKYQIIQMSKVTTDIAT